MILVFFSESKVCLPNYDSLVVAACSNQELVIRAELDFCDVRRMGSELIELGILDSAWILE
jgi:hypothetical protein